MMNITKEFFEHAVPAFETCGDEIFERMQTFLAEAAEETDTVAGPDWEQYATDNPKLAGVAKTYICCRAARTAIPQLDLVLTQNGFGVVNTNNVAPASRERVNALTEQMRHRESRLHDEFFKNLIRLEVWRNTDYCHRMFSSLLWSPSACRSCGITFDGSPVYSEEFAQLKPAIAAAESALMQLLPWELYNKLAKDVVHRELPYPYSMVMDLALRFLQLHIMHLYCDGVAQDLVTCLESNAQSLPEYMNSSHYKANHITHYENSKKSKCHFWS